MTETPSPSHSRTLSMTGPPTLTSPSAVVAMGGLQLARTRSLNAGPGRQQGSFSNVMIDPAVLHYMTSKSRASSVSEPCTTSSFSSLPQSPAVSFLSTFAERSIPKAPDPDEEGTEIGKYVLGKVLGHGMFSTVREAFTMQDGGADEIRVVAVKILRKDKERQDSVENEISEYMMERELDLWRQIDHPNLVSLIEIDENSHSTFVFCEHCPGGTMLVHLRKNGTPGFPEQEVRRLWVQLASGVLYLHEILRVAHRDIKLENIMLTDEKNVKLGDFGFAEYLDRSSSSPASATILTPENLGSLAYCAPELIRRKAHPQEPTTPISSVNATAAGDPITPHSFQSRFAAGDAWALGVVLYALVTGKLPFADEFEPRMVLKIINVQYPWSGSSSSAVSSPSAPYLPMPTTSSSALLSSSTYPTMQTPIPPPSSDATNTTPLSPLRSPLYVPEQPISPTQRQAQPQATAILSSSSNTSSASPPTSASSSPPTSASSSLLTSISNLMVQQQQQRQQQQQQQPQQLQLQQQQLPQQQPMILQNQLSSAFLRSRSTSFMGGETTLSRRGSTVSPMIDPRLLGSNEVRAVVAGLLNGKWKERWGVRQALDNRWCKAEEQ